MHAEGEAVAAEIDGGQWHLPLAPLSSTSLPEPYSAATDSAVDTTRAAARLTRNHAAVCKFATRGAGQIGSRPVSAPLSDPSAVPVAEAEPQVDAALRHIAHALLVGDAAKQAGGLPLEVRNFVIAVHTKPPLRLGDGAWVVVLL